MPCCDLQYPRVGYPARAAGIVLEDTCVVALACLFSSNCFLSLDEPEKIKVRAGAISRD